MVFFSDQDGKQGIYNCWPYYVGPSCCTPPPTRTNDFANFERVKINNQSVTRTPWLLTLQQVFLKIIY